MKGLSSIIAGLMLMSCATQGSAAEDSSAADAIRIRITNISETPFSDFTVRFPSAIEEYGPLLAGESTEYREVEIAYKYASVMVMAEGRMYRALVADYLGETRLGPGSYTYTIDLIGRSPRLGFLVDEE
jgi:hypothetical protein